MTGPAESALPLIRAMDIADHEDVMALMRQTPGITIRDADQREATDRYLKRNPGLSFVAVASGTLVGCLMAGHDGRRGYLQHLVVHPVWRQRGIGTRLVEQCLAGLERQGIFKSHVDVLQTQRSAQDFWTKRAWTLRTDMQRYSIVRAGGDNA